MFDELPDRCIEIEFIFHIHDEMLWHSFLFLSHQIDESAQSIETSLILLGECLDMIFWNHKQDLF